MNVMRYEPLALHRDLLNEFNRMFERSASNDGSTSATADWAPAVDIEESGNQFKLYVDVPGIDPNAIELTLDNSVLTISGTRERQVVGEEVQQRRSERQTGRFHRRFTLPDSADHEGVTARGHNGVLEIVIPKRAALASRKIAIEA